MDTHELIDRRQQRPYSFHLKIFLELELDFGVRVLL